MGTDKGTGTAHLRDETPCGFIPLRVSVLVNSAYRIDDTRWSMLELYAWLSRQMHEYLD